MPACRANRLNSLPVIRTAVSSTTRAETCGARAPSPVAAARVRCVRVAFGDDSDTSRRVAALMDASGRDATSVITSVNRQHGLLADRGLEQNSPNLFVSCTAKREAARRT